MPYQTVKIILTGPESSGKTTLAQQLAKHFQLPLVEEYARFYLKNTTHYEYEDLLKIAIGQLEIENTETENELKILDTDLITIKIWSQDVFKKCDDFITQSIENQSVEYCFYLLCSPENVNWEYDPLRENPHDRERLFKLYKNELKFYKKKYVILRGGINERFKKAVREINKYLKTIH